MVHHATAKLDDLLASIYDAFQPAPGSSDKENDAGPRREGHPLGSKRVIRTFLGEVGRGDRGHGAAALCLPAHPSTTCPPIHQHPPTRPRMHPPTPPTHPPTHPTHPCMRQVAEKTGGLWLCKPKYVDKWGLAKEVPEDKKALLPGSSKKKRAWGRGPSGRAGAAAAGGAR